VLRRALANRALRRALAAFAIFNICEWAAWIALLVWAYNRAGVSGASAISIIQLVPAALLAPTCASVAGRLPREWALSVGYGAQAVTYSATAAVLTLDASYAVVAATAVTASVAVTVTRPTHFALLPALSQTTQDITAANSASGSLAGVATFVGPALSGLLLATAGAASVLFATGVASGLSVLITARLVESGGSTWRGGRPTGERRPSVFRTMRAPGVQPLITIVGADAVLLGTLDILLVVLALHELHLNDSGPGVLNSAMGVGSLVGAAATVLLIGRTRLAPAILIGAVIAGAGVASAALVAVPTLCFGLIVVGGAGRSFVEVTTNTLLQRSVRDEELTAVLGLQESLLMAGTALGALIAAPLVDGLGTRGAFAVAGLILPLVAALSWRQLRQLDQHASVPGPTYALLAGIPFFAVLTQRVIERLARDLTPVTAAAGTRLTTEGQGGDTFYVVESGQLQVTQAGGRVLRTLGPGDWFGEIALLKDIPRTSTVTALTEVALQALNRRPFLSAVTGMPTAMQAADDQAKRYRDLSGEPS
jgi:MFS family permease